MCFLIGCSRSIPDGSGVTGFVLRDKLIGDLPFSNSPTSSVSGNALSLLQKSQTEWARAFQIEPRNLRESLRRPAGEMLEPGTDYRLNKAVTCLFLANYRTPYEASDIRPHQVEVNQRWSIRGNKRSETTDGALAIETVMGYGLFLSQARSLPPKLSLYPSIPTDLRP